MNDPNFFRELNLSKLYGIGNHWGREYLAIKKITLHPGSYPDFDYTLFVEPIPWGQLEKAAKDYNVPMIQASKISSCDFWEIQGFNWFSMNDCPKGILEHAFFHFVNDWVEEKKAEDFKRIFMTAFNKPVSEEDIKIRIIGITGPDQLPYGTIDPEHLVLFVREAGTDVADYTGKKQRGVTPAGIQSADYRPASNDTDEFLGHSTIANEKKLRGHKAIADFAGRSEETVKKWKLVKARYATKETTGRIGHDRKTQVCIYPSALDRFLQERENRKQK